MNNPQQVRALIERAVDTLESVLRLTKGMQATIVDLTMQEKFLLGQYEEGLTKANEILKEILSGTQ